MSTVVELGFIIGKTKKTFSIFIPLCRVYVPVETLWRGEKYLVCHQQLADWVVNYVGEDYYFTTYFMFRVIFVHLLPCIMLILLNILLFRAMRVVQKKRQKLFDKKTNDKNRTTLMLIIVVSVFLIVSYLLLPEMMFL